MGSVEQDLENDQQSQERAIYDRWRSNLPRIIDIFGFVEDTMRDFLLRDAPWEDWIRKDDVGSWNVLVNGVGMDILDDSHALDHLANELLFDNLINDLDNAGFNTPTYTELVRYKLGYRFLDRRVKQLVDELLTEGELPIKHMHGQGEHTWTLRNVIGNLAEEEVVSLGYTATDKTAKSTKNHKTYYLDVYPVKRSKKLYLELSGITDWVPEQLAFIAEELTDEVFLEIEKEIRRLRKSRPADIEL